MLDLYGLRHHREMIVFSNGLERPRAVTTRRSIARVINVIRAVKKVHRRKHRGSIRSLLRFCDQSSRHEDGECTKNEGRDEYFVEDCHVHHRQRPFQVSNLASVGNALAIGVSIGTSGTF